MTSHFSCGDLRSVRLKSMNISKTGEIIVAWQRDQTLKYPVHCSTFKAGIVLGRLRSRIRCMLAE